MDLDTRSKLCLHLGSLMLTNIELGDQLQLQKTRADKLQAAADAAAKAAADAAAAQVKHDVAADTRTAQGA